MAKKKIAQLLDSEYTTEELLALRVGWAPTHP